MTFLTSSGYVDEKLWKWKTKMPGKIRLTAVFLLAFASPAMAQSDFNPTQSWDELYVGGIAGQALGDSNKINGSGSGSRVGNFPVNGIFGGGEIGFNQHWGHFMFGVELDAAGSGATGHKTCVQTSYQCYTEQHWNTTLRPRVGYRFGPITPFLTAGVAYGDVTSYRNSPSLGISNDLLQSNAEVGIVAGAGVEYGITRTWSVKAQYLYTHYTDQHVSNLADTAYSVIPLHESLFEGAVDYHFY